MSKSNIFTQALMPKVGSNAFDLSHDVKFSCKMGTLVPTCVLEVIPGDKINLSTQNMLRFAPLVSPVMHKIDVTTHYFFVPNRILWAEWEKWITGESDSLVPYVKANDTPNGSIGDFLGYQANAAALNQSALPIAAYAKIYDEYYRDQNLQPDLKFTPLVSGQNTAAYGDMIDERPFKRAWQHDYLTSCLPFAQKGEAVTLPLINESSVDVTYKEPTPTTATATLLRDAVTGNVVTSGNLNATAGGSMQNGSVDVNVDPNGSLEVDVNAEAVTINTFRIAIRLQEWLEKNARGGTRYIENILSHFGVKSSDARLQRPEYIGGSRQKMVISEVLSTAQTVDQGSNDIPVGNLAGHGISVGGGNKFSYRAEEHGIIIGIINVRPKTAYSQGLQKMFRRFDRLDYYWPSFAHIGEQAVKNYEAYATTGTEEELEETFGYIPRYSEYKYQNSRVHGEMRSSLEYWHLGRKFNTAPALNASFIECEPDPRIFADTEGDHLFCHVFNNIKAIRKMPKFAVPTL